MKNDIVNDVFSTPTGFYCCILPTLREVCYKHGYALAVHGSMRRDLDVIAIPWVETASKPQVLCDDMVKELGGYTIQALKCDKPHGRMTCPIRFNQTSFYIDFCIMPLMPLKKNKKVKHKKVNECPYCHSVIADNMKICLDCKEKLLYDENK